MSACFTVVGSQSVFDGFCAVLWVSKLFRYHLGNVFVKRQYINIGNELMSGRIFTKVPC